MTVWIGNISRWQNILSGSEVLFGGRASSARVDLRGVRSLGWVLPRQGKTYLFRYIGITFLWGHLLWPPTPPRKCVTVIVCVWVPARVLNGCYKMLRVFVKIIIPEHSVARVEECSGCNGYILRACAPAHLNGGCGVFSVFENISPGSCHVRLWRRLLGRGLWLWGSVSEFVIRWSCIFRGILLPVVSTPVITIQMMVLIHLGRS